MFRSAILLGCLLALATIVTAHMRPAAANSCQQSCRAQWNQCRINTKGSASCDAQLESCMQACIPRR